MNDYAEVLKLCGCAVIALILVRILRSSDACGFGGLTAVCFSVIIAAAAMRGIIPLLHFLHDTTTPYLDTEYADVFWRAMAVGVTVQLTSDTIRDAGEGALADKVDFAGRAALLCIGLPLYEAILSLAKTLLGL
ncbi:MAG: stage III sporulation AC/AD family protein [Clostridia bacterium]|nr:stage III sporulation AC/AD family protein [Clostridia bacterium]